MNALASLATTALLGTERRPPEWPAPEGPLGELLAKLSRDQIEKALLQTAGVLGTCHLAGWQPPVITRTASVAQDDVLQAVSSPAMQQTLSSILTDGPVRLQAEAFQKLTAANRSLPHRLLPKALDAGKRSTALRPYLLRVLGQRGAWLAAQNDAWAYAVGGGAETLDADVWQHGSLDQRRLYLTALRASDAAKARELITVALTTEGARERTAFIECLVTALSLDDQDLLEATLADKSKEARQAAAHLLASLPGSQFMQRMSIHLEPLLKTEKKLLRGTTFTIEAPLAYDVSWKSDLIEETKPKGQLLGERAWWLCQIIACTSLDWWKVQTGMSANELLAWAQTSDWKASLLQGWAEAQNCQRSMEWAEAFLAIPIPARQPLTDRDLLAVLPQPLQEKFILQMVTTSNPEAYPLSTVLAEIFHNLPLDATSLSEKTGHALLHFLKTRVNNGEARYDWQLRATLVELACIMPPVLFDDFANGWDITKDEVQPFAEAVARVGIVLDQRQQLLSLKS